MAFPDKVGTRPFPVEGCSGQVLTQTEMPMYFWNQNIRDTVVILEEDNLHHPR